MQQGLTTEGLQDVISTFEASRDKIHEALSKQKEASVDIPVWGIEDEIEDQLEYVWRCHLSAIENLKEIQVLIDRRI